MHKTYVTFGQAHRHEINGEIFDHNCVAVIRSEGPAQGRELAFKFFGPKFCVADPEKHFNHASIHVFPRGLVDVPQEEEC